LSAFYRHPVVRKFCSFVRSTQYEYVAFSLISTYTILCFIDLFIHPSYVNYNYPAAITNLVFGTLFTIEITLRLFAYFIEEFWQSYKNRFNLFCVIISIPSYIAYIMYS